MRALVLSFSPIARDPRVMRQVRALAPRFELTVAGFGEPPQGVARFVKLAWPQGPRISLARAGKALLLAARRFETYYWKLAYVKQGREALNGSRFDLVVANDVNTLPLALALADGAPVLFDAHEYSPREFEDRLVFRLLRAPYLDYLCRRYLSRARAVTTVAEGIADAYFAGYGVRADVVPSAPAYAELRPGAVDPTRVRMVHHGAAAPSRKLELMIGAMDLLDERFELDLMLVPGDPRYIARIADMAKRNARIRVLPPVRMEEIVPFTNQYDVGLFLLPPTNFNYAHALPNKFFEFIQARLAVAIGPSPEMKRLVDRYDCGVVSEDFTPQSLARALSALNPERLAELKANADRAAAELCWEKQEPVFLAAVERAMGAR